jgi:hypothetical protein
LEGNGDLQILKAERYIIASQRVPLERRTDGKLPI